MKTKNNRKLLGFYLVCYWFLCVCLLCFALDHSPLHLCKFVYMKTKKTQTTTTKNQENNKQTNKLTKKQSNKATTKKTQEKHICSLAVSLRDSQTIK